MGVRNLIMTKKVTLIAPPMYSIGKLRNGPHNLGLGYIAAYLEMQGHNVQIIDAVVEGLEHSFKISDERSCAYPGQEITQTGLSYTEITNRIEVDSDFIGITIPFTSLAVIAQELSLVIKKRFPNKPIILGGVYPSTLAEHAVSTCAVDYVVRGEGEMPMLELIEGISPDSIRGLVFKEGTRIIDNGIAQQIENLNDLPFPARHLMPMEKYIHFSPRGKGNKRRVSMITSRGCPFDCNFCSIHSVFGYNFRGRSAQNVLEEIKQIVNEYKIELIEFEDDNLTFNQERAEAIFDGIIELNKSLDEKITWSCHNGLRIDTLNRNILKKIKESGCVCLELAVESGDRETLARMNKNLNLDKVLEIVSICSELKIRMMAYMIVGYPGETRENFKNSLNFFLRLKKMGISSFATHLIKAYPNTKLWKYCLENNYLVHSDIVNVRFLESCPVLERRYVGVVDKNSDAGEILKRRNYAHKKLNPKQYIKEAMIKKIKKFWYFFKKIKIK